MQRRLRITVLTCCLAILCGCNTERPYQPGVDYPEWAFDKPTYYEPPADPVPFIQGVDGRPDIYYDKQYVVFIKRQSRPELHEVPRPAVYVTQDNGQIWEKVGHFGKEQVYFAFQVKEDGTYGVCVIGPHRPDLAPANLEIQQIQVIDATTPQVEVTISPEEGPYWTGQQIILSWTITDPHLSNTPGRLYSKVVESDKPTPWELRKAELASSGTVVITIEQLPLRAEGLLFRIEAVDQMGNVATAHTKMVQLMPSSQVTPTKAKAPEIRRTPAKSTTATVIVPRAEPTPATPTPPENIPPWSWQEESDQSTPAEEYQEPKDEPGEPESKLEESNGMATQPTLALAEDADSELAELERLLAGASNPVFQGKVRQSPQEKMIDRTIAAEPAPRELPDDIVIKIEQHPPEQATKTPVSVVAASPVEERSEKPVIAKVAPAKEQTPVEPAIAEALPEPTEPLIVPLESESPPRSAEPVEPIVTVKPPSEAELPAEPTAEALIEPSEPKMPAPEVATPAQPTPEPTPIVTAKPTMPAQQPQQLSPPTASAQILSHGKNRLAKPWERLGNRAGAARDFYKYAPALSNY